MSLASTKEDRITKTLIITSCGLPIEIMVESQCCPGCLLIHLFLLSKHSLKLNSTLKTMICAVIEILSLSNPGITAVSPQDKHCATEWTVRTPFGYLSVGVTSRMIKKQILC
ncbi:hypothetical protein CEXT_699781 [Caerostris extrusa]|uniref:Uncharacterized protein n=1 Tax=Caerostris extrusa TaxID=172846 RepID=A0AAV4PP39_CAEEX|nr:hypothetical protein CEXT_699781 [Caerostris extrusa]